MKDHEVSGPKAVRLKKKEGGSKGGGAKKASGKPQPFEAEMPAGPPDSRTLPPVERGMAGISLWWQGSNNA